MRFAALQRKNDAGAPSPGGLRIGDAHDSYEQEADRVAERVSSGGHLGGWSIAKVDMGRLQRDPTNDAPQSPGPQPKPDNYDEAAKKIGEAFLKTDAGKQLLDAAKADPLVKDAEAFVETLPGKVIAGAAAVSAVSALAATHTPLPAQIPAIPLDSVKPGLTVKITYEGPVDKPTKAMITIGYTPKAATSKKKGKETQAEKYHAQTQALAADQRKFREGLKSPYEKRLEAAEEQEQLNAYLRYRHDPLAPAAAAGAPAGGGLLNQPAAPAGGLQLQPPQFQSPLQKHGASLMNQKLKLESIPGLDTSKKEDTPVQRKAAGQPLLEDATPVREAIRSGGRPLDAETRRAMESGFGYDFRKVRIHDDAQAAESARALGAHAYTTGTDVVFAAGRYDPQSEAGRKLLAHELTHVVQQSRDLPARPAGIRSAPVQIQRDVDEGTEEKDSSSWFSNPIEKIKKFVRKLPGYKLFTLILGKDPVTNEKVELNSTNLLMALFNLIKADDVFKRIQESGALEKAYQWVVDELARLELNWNYFKGLIDQALDSVSWKDIKDPKAALERIADIFRPAYEKVKTFAFAAADKVLEFAMEAALALVGGTGILDTFRQIGDAFKKILKDPMAFLSNLVDALKLGFNNFLANIVEHLKKAVVEWIFGEIASTGIRLPKKFDLAGILSLILQVLGLTWDRFRLKLVGLIGEDAVRFLEGAFDFLVQLAKAKDLGVAWKMILEKADNLIDTMLDAVKSWVIETIVKTAIVKVIAMLNPAGAIVQAIQAIYKTVSFFIEKAKQIKALVDAIIKSISNIAYGKLQQAADYVEATMGKTLPVIIGFLADQIGLGGIGKTVAGIIKKVQDRVDKAVDKVLEWIVSKGKGFYEKAKATAGQVLEWFKQRKDVLVGDEEHSIYMEGSEDSPKLMIASVPGKSWSEYLQNKKPPAGKSDLLKQTRKMCEDVEKPLPPSKDDKEKADNVEKKRKLFNDIAANIVALGFSAEDNAPASVIKYGDTRAEDGGGNDAEANPLSLKHPKGTPPSDEPPIWKKLGSLVGKKNYVQGHLLNHNVGGEGRRFNLTPINKKANADHLNKIERTVKKTVHQDKKVMSYKVHVVYGGHTEKPKRYLKLQDMQKNGALSGKQKTEIAEFEAEQLLCTKFEYRAAELTYDGQQKQWVEVKNGVTYEDKVENKIEE